jgi:hypothetical protein
MVMDFDSLLAKASDVVNPVSVIDSGVKGFRKSLGRDKCIVWPDGELLLMRCAEEKPSIYCCFSLDRKVLSEETSIQVKAAVRIWRNNWGYLLKR